MAVVISVPASQPLDAVLTIVLAAAVIAQWRLLVSLLRQNGRLLLRIEALEGGGARPLVRESESLPPLPGPIPAFSLPDLEGNFVSLDDLRSLNRAILLVFLHADCTVCSLLLPEVARWQQEYGDRVTVVVVAEEASSGLIEAASANALQRVLIGGSREVIGVREAGPLPSAVLLAPDGRILGGPISGADGIRILLSTAVRERDTVAIPSRDET
jgi:thiol-disulfide isomerase/thioredoxin